MNIDLLRVNKVALLLLITVTARKSILGKDVAFHEKNNDKNITKLLKNRQ